MQPTRFIYLALSLSAAYPAASHAAFVYINDPVISLNTSNPSFPNGLGSTVFQVKYRLSASNFDLSTAPYGGTGTSGTTWLSSNLGNVNQLAATTWNFSLTNTPGQNLVLSFSRGTTTFTQTWGAGGTATLNSPTNLPQGPQARLYNTLRITARSSTNGATASISNLSFTAAGQSASPASAFRADTATPTTAGPSLSNFPTDSNGFFTQWLVADVNLASIAWNLAGQVTLDRTGGGDGEAVRFTIDGLESLAQFPPPTTPFDTTNAPEPLSALLTGAGLVLFGLNKKSR